MTIQIFPQKVQKLIFEAFEISQHYLRKYDFKVHLHTLYAHQDGTDEYYYQECWQTRIKNQRLARIVLRARMTAFTIYWITRDFIITDIIALLKGEPDLLYYDNIADALSDIFYLDFQIYVFAYHTKYQAEIQKDSSPFYLLSNRPYYNIDEDTLHYVEALIGTKLIDDEDYKQATVLQLFNKL